MLFLRAMERAAAVAKKIWPIDPPGPYIADCPDPITTCPSVDGLEMNRATCSCRCSKEKELECHDDGKVPALSPEDGSCKCFCPEEKECGVNMMQSEETCTCVCDKTLDCPKNQRMLLEPGGQFCSCGCSDSYCPRGEENIASRDGTCKCQCRSDVSCPRFQKFQRQDDGSCACSCDDDRYHCDEGYRQDPASCRCMKIKREPPTCPGATVYDRYAGECVCPPCPFQNQVIVEGAPLCTCGCRMQGVCPHGADRDRFMAVFSHKSNKCRCACRKGAKQECLDQVHYKWIGWPSCICSPTRVPQPRPEDISHPRCAADKVVCDSNSLGCINQAHKHMQEWWLCPNTARSCRGTCLCSHKKLGRPMPDCAARHQHGSVKCFKLDGEPHLRSGYKGRTMSHLGPSGNLNC